MDAQAAVDWTAKYPSLATPPDDDGGGITPRQWAHFDTHGYVVLPAAQVFRGADTAQLQALQAEIDAIQMGVADVPYDRMMMQLDSSTGRYEDSGAQTLGHKGATLRYRKIQNLDLDPVVLAYLRKPLFREACSRVYGAATPIASFRTMFFNKPARLGPATSGGTRLPWHQDRWKFLDRDPLLNVYLALDAAVPETGCMKIVPGSHKLGVLNPDHHSAFLSPQNLLDMKLSADGSGGGGADAGSNDAVRDFWLHPGEVALMHNWLIHCSGVNSTPHPRRALSVSYMDARSKLTKDVFSAALGGELKTTGYPEGGMDFPLIFEAAAPTASRANDATADDDDNNSR